MTPAPRAANIQLNFTSLSDLALNMEHSVCKVSLAHHTKEWLSALFEALDGLELRVNNYLFTLLWIACRNKRLSHHLYQRSPPSSLHIATYYDLQDEGTGNGDAACVHIKMLLWACLPLHCQSCGWGLWPVKILPLGFWSWLVFSSASQTEKSCSVQVPLVTGAISGYIYKDLCFSNYFSKARRELSLIHDHCGSFSLSN